MSSQNMNVFGTRNTQHNLRFEPTIKDNILHAEYRERKIYSEIFFNAEDFASEKLKKMSR